MHTTPYVYIQAFYIRYIYFYIFVLEGQLSGKQFAVNMCVDCFDAECVSVQAALGWWNNPGWVQRLFLRSAMCPPWEHSTRNSGEVSPWAQHARSAGVNKGLESSPRVPLLQDVLQMPHGEKST